MKNKELHAIVQAAAKITVEAALNAELDDHLGFSKYEQSDAGNYRNGSTRKTLRTEDGQLELDTPRDRSGSFEPKLAKKHQRRSISMDDKILFLYAQGISTREIVTTFKEMYDADASTALISKATDTVIDEAIEWQSQPLDTVYPVVYLDGIAVKIYQSSTRLST